MIIMVWAISVKKTLTGRGPSTAVMGGINQFGASVGLRKLHF